jgi:predicted RNA-binding protein
MARTYWLDLFTGVTWKEFVDAGASVTGFRESRWKTLQKTAIGDYFLCYVTGISRFIGILEITSEPFFDRDNSIWKDEEFPCRVNVRPIVTLTPETAVPVFELRDSLSVFQNLKNPNAWTGHFRSSPSKWKSSDGEAVVQAVHDAHENPVARPVDERKLNYRPKAIRSKSGTVTIPDSEQTAERPTSGVSETATHTEIQWRLLKLGSDMGFDVWVARNDKSRDFDGHKLSSVPRLKSELPTQFDETTNRTIELIDVLWLRGNGIAAAFEIESTTSIYSGLLRMSDLIAMQPNLNIPLYLVAPDDRQDKVVNEINRPTFSRLNPPLSEVCRYISFSALQRKLDEVGSYIKYLRPEFLDELSESCVLNDA